MFLPFAGGCLIDACFVGANCMAQACCWYHVFRCCGCVKEKEHVKLQEPPPPPPPKAIPKAIPVSNNPFVDTGLPKDKHLQSAYNL